MPDPRALEPVRPDPRQAHLRLHPDQLAALPEHDYGKKLDEMHAALALLVQHARAPKRHMPVNTVAQGGTDGSGNLILGVWNVREGFRLEPQHIVIEASGYTPAAPFTAGAAWLGLYQAANANLNSVGQGGLLDFAPTTAGAQLVPAFADYGAGELQVQGGNVLVLRIAGGPTSRLVTVRLQGWLIGEQV